MAAIDDRFSDLTSFNPKRNFKGLFGDYRDVDPYGTLNPEQRNLVKALGPRLQAISAGGPQQYRYGGQLSMDITPEEQNAVDRYGRIAALSEPSLSKLVNYDDAAFNEQFTNEIANPAFDDFRRNTQPLLEEALPTFSTARANVLSRNLGDLQNNLLQTRFNAREAAKNRSLDAIGAAGQFGATSAAIASIPREIKQAGFDREYGDFIQANQQYQTAINQMLNFLGISTGTTQEDHSIDRILALIGAGANVYGAAKGGA